MANVNDLIELLRKSKELGQTKPSTDLYAQEDTATSDTPTVDEAQVSDALDDSSLYSDEDLEMLGGNFGPREEQPQLTAPTPVAKSPKPQLPITDVPQQIPITNIPQEQESLTTRLAKLTTEPSKTSPKEDFYKQLTDAMKQSKKDVNRINLMESAAQLGQAIAGAKPNADLSSLRKAAEAGPEDVVSKSKMKQFSVDLTNKEDMNDSNSDISVTARAFLKQKFPNMNIPENTTAQQLKDLGIKLDARTLSSFQRINWESQSTGKKGIGIMNKSTGIMTDLQGNPLPADVVPFFAPIVTTVPGTGEKSAFSRGTGTLTPITGPNKPQGKDSSGMQTEEEQEAAPLDKTTLNTEEFKNLVKERDAMRKDPIVSKGRFSLENLEMVRELTNADSYPMAKAAVAKLANAAYGGRAPMTELKQLGGPQTIVADLQTAIAQKFTNKNPAELEKYLRRMEKILSKVHQDSVNHATKTYGQAVKSAIPWATNEQIGTALGVDTLLPKSETKLKEGYVAVQKGDKIQQIPAKNLVEAEKRGWMKIGQ